MDRDYLKQLRRRLKASLKSNRGRLVHKKWLAICDYCGEPILRNEPDMHEAIITRQHVRGNPELLPEIMVKYNCVLLHHGWCHEQAMTDDGKRIIISRLIQNEGLEDIIGWLEIMEQNMITDTPTTMKRLVIEVNDEMQGVRQANR